MPEALLLGLIQGIAEWLPVSSEGIIVLVHTNLFGGQAGLTHLLEYALFLHAGTFLAALIYLWRDVWRILKSAFSSSDVEARQLLKFLSISTLISGGIGFAFLRAISGLEGELVLPGRAITAAVGVLLLITGFLQRTAPQSGTREAAGLAWKDALVLGIVQGLAVLPGLSRSGLTISALLLRGMAKREALRVSFLMSLPIVLIGNLALNAKSCCITLASWVGLGVACVAGLATIRLLFYWARRVNFSAFVFGFGLLTLLVAAFQ